MSLKNIDLGLYGLGDIINVAIDEVRNNSHSTITGVEVLVDVPSGVEYSSHSVPQGTYDPLTNIWSVGALYPGAVVGGVLMFEITEDCQEKYTFNFEVVTSESCEPNKANNTMTQCYSGISCCDIQKCIPGPTANDDSYVVPQNDIDYPGDASLNDITGTGLPGSIETYEWVDVSGAQGSITGPPNAFAYTPTPGFVGVGQATYAQLIDGEEVDRATVYFNITGGSAVDTQFIGITDAPLIGSVADSIVGCLNGGISSYHLVSNETANGSGLSEPTTSDDVLVTDWNQDTGEFVMAPSNGWVGAAEFYYFIRCTDEATGRSVDSGPASVRITIPVPVSTIEIDCGPMDPLGPGEIYDAVTGLPMSICSLFRDDCTHFYPIKTVDADYLADPSDDVILVDNSTGAVNISVDPSIFYDSGPDKGKELNIKVIGTVPVGPNAVTVTSLGGLIVSDSAAVVYSFTSAGQNLRLRSNGINLYSL